MAEEALFETEADRSREEIATLLEQLAAQVRHGVVHARDAGGEHRLELPAQVYCEVELEREGDGRHELEVELGWQD